VSIASQKGRSNQTTGGSVLLVADKHTRNDNSSFNFADHHPRHGPGIAPETSPHLRPLLPATRRTQRKGRASVWHSPKNSWSFTWNDNCEIVLPKKGRYFTVVLPIAQGSVQEQKKLQKLQAGQEEERSGKWAAAVQEQKAGSNSFSCSRKPVVLVVETMPI